MNILKLIRWNKKPSSPQKYSGVGTVLISNISKLDQVASSHSPESMVELLKRHLATQSEIIDNHSGFVLSFMGDSILAFWPMIDVHSNCGLQAFEAALKMLSSVDNEVDYQIVLATGLLAGDFIGPKKQYQVVGEAKDVADQLSNYRYSGHRVILFIESTKVQLENMSLSFQTIGQLNNGSNIIAYII